VAALVSTVLPVGIAIAGGERLTVRMLAGGLICLVAIAGVSMPAARRGRQGHRDGPDAGAARLRGLAYGAAAGAGFGLFFLCLKNAGQSRARREPWSPWASRWPRRPARGGATVAGRA